MAGTPDAVVIGSGPNGLTAAIEIARAGRSVLLLEAAPVLGGGLRSAELTLPGFVHDICSSVHPMAVRSPVFTSMPLARHGLHWVEPPLMLAHPFDDERAAVLQRSLPATAEALAEDGPAYRALFERVMADWPRIEGAVTGPWQWPRHPFALAQFARRALGPVTRLARRQFARPDTRALFAGMAAHGMLPLEARPTAGVAMGLGLMAHVAGWSFPRGGAQALANALAAHLRDLGGTIETDTRVTSIDDLPPARAVLCDLSPRPLLAIAGHRFPSRYRRALERYRYGMGTFKVDWALDGPIPWRAPVCAQAGTLHLGGSLEEIAACERETWAGRIPVRPYVLLTQATPFDASRAPAGRHTAWAYCHVPHGATRDMTAVIEAQVERFAPGFRATILARHTLDSRQLEAHNPNLVGGDIGAGAQDLRQFLFRPVPRLNPYATPAEGLFLCSASTPPGAGVHGMCGYHAARAALRRLGR
jgi:phytoene dehydrogenase-like protein